MLILYIQCGNPLVGLETQGKIVLCMITLYLTFKQLQYSVLSTTKYYSCKYLYMYMYYMYVYIYIHTHIHTYMHTHIRISCMLDKSIILHEDTILNEVEKK